ncbi:MAG: NFACT family protein [Candidatus Aenigmarchaeota archaeon]|nr:NFACT family protein [Candidatus Aenigmarchaeota archaeon]
MDKKESLLSLDIHFLARELQQLVGMRIKKVSQIGKEGFVFRIYVRQKGNFDLFDGEGKLFLTEYKLQAIEPSGFCMLLRKLLYNKIIESIKQHSFDRILEISTASHVLIIELLEPFNIVICSKDMAIVMPLKTLRFRDRTIERGIKYEYPPRQTNPLETQVEDLVRQLGVSDRKLVAFLALLGFGQAYSKEICFRAGLEEGLISKLLKREEAEKLLSAIKDISSAAEPRLYENFPSPIELRHLSQSSISLASFSQACDEYFIPLMFSGNPEKEEKETAGRKIENIKKAREKKKEELEKNADRCRGKGEAIYSHHETVRSIMETLVSKRKQNVSWQDIKNMVKQSDTAEAHAIKEIRENEGIVILKLGDMEVELDITKSIEENASGYFEMAKKSKRKLEGLEKSKDIAEKKFSREKRKEPGKIPAKKQKWFEKFRWFTTSDGFLVIGGRSADDNETIFKKHIEKGDLVFHADIQGASLVVLKIEGRKLTEISMKEAAEFAAAGSKAWQASLGAVDVYCVKSDQISKSPPSGTFLPKGSFMVTGQKIWFRDMEMKTSIGVKIDRQKGLAAVVYGPPYAAKKHSDYFLTIMPGEIPAPDLAKEIKKSILMKARPEDKPAIEAVSIDDIVKGIPSGQGKIFQGF